MCATPCSQTPIPSRTAPLVWYKVWRNNVRLPPPPAPAPNGLPCEEVLCLRCLLLCRPKLDPPLLEPPLQRLHPPPELLLRFPRPVCRLAMAASASATAIVPAATAAGVAVDDAVFADESCFGVEMASLDAILEVGVLEGGGDGPFRRRAQQSRAMFR